MMHRVRSRRSWLLAVADLARSAAVASFVYSLVAMDAVAAALFALVLLGVTVPRAVRLPRALDMAVCAVLLVAAWCALLDWYVAFPWLDVVVHALATGLLAVTVYFALVRAGLLAAPRAPGLRRPRAGAVLSVAFLGLGLGVLWELGEWFGQTYLDHRIQTGYADTIGDLAMGGAGALAAGLALVTSVASGCRSSTREVAPSVLVTDGRGQRR